MKTLKIEISWSSILKVIALLLTIFFIVKLESIIITVILAYIIVAALSPIIESLERKGIKKGFSIPIVYISLLAFFGLLIFLISKPLVDAMVTFVNELPHILERLTQQYPELKSYVPSDSKGIEQFLKNNTENLKAPSEKALGFLTSTFGAFTSFITIIIISIYALLNKKGLFNKIFYLVAKEKRHIAENVSQRVEVQFGAWVRGQMILMITIGLLNFVAFHLIGLGKYAVPLAILAGLLELLPIIGPIVAGAMAVLVGLSISPIVAVLAAISGFIIQQLENIVVVPAIMKKAVGLDPVFTIIVILIGAELMGIIGAILAVPITAVFTSIFLYFYENKKALAQT